MQKMTTDQEPILQKMWQTYRRNIPITVLVLLGFVMGLLWFGALRYLLHQSNETHYHANFAVYIDGKREEFKSFTYYEEVAACTAAFANNPKGRAHMHDTVNDVIHVHAAAVTYADFFNAIDWSLGPNFVRTGDGLITNNVEKSWVFILNGKKVDRVDSVVIGDQDKLLISYGAADTKFDSQYAALKNKAAATDAKTDPASCSGLNGPEDTGITTRLKDAFNFTL